MKLQRQWETNWYDKDFGNLISCFNTKVKDSTKLRAQDTGSSKVSWVPWSKGNCFFVPTSLT